MLHQTSEHIDGHSVASEELAQDVQQYIDRAKMAIVERPLTALFTAVVAGFAIGRLFRR